MKTMKALTPIKWRYVDGDAVIHVHQTDDGHFTLEDFNMAVLQRRVRTFEEVQPCAASMAAAAIEIKDLMRQIAFHRGERS